LSSVKIVCSSLGVLILFGVYLLLMLLTAGGYCIKLLVDLLLTEIVTGFWRMGKKIGMGIGE
jgi:hypothetical protein